MDNDRDQFHADLLQGVQEMKARKIGRATQVQPTEASEARAKVGASQSEFADLLGVSVRTLQDWEQGRRQPTGAAKTLLRVAQAHPEALRDLQLA